MLFDGAEHGGNLPGARDIRAQRHGTHAQGRDFRAVAWAPARDWW